MTALERIREEQEELATHSELLAVGDAWRDMHRKWLALQREALAILRGEKCEEHGFEMCSICKPPGPVRGERG